MYPDMRAITRLTCIEILSFSCSEQLLVNADGKHLQCQNAKNQKWLNAIVVVVLFTSTVNI